MNKVKSYLDFKYQVAVTHLSYDERYDAAKWAFDHFGAHHVNVFVTGSSDTFVFRKEEDAIFFALKWVK